MQKNIKKIAKEQQKSQRKIEKAKKNAEKNMAKVEKAHTPMLKRFSRENNSALRLMSGFPHSSKEDRTSEQTQRIDKIKAKILKKIMDDEQS